MLKIILFIVWIFMVLLVLAFCKAASMGDEQIEISKYEEKAREENRKGKEKENV